MYVSHVRIPTRINTVQKASSKSECLAYERPTMEDKSTSEENTRGERLLRTQDDITTLIDFSQTFSRVGDAHG